MTGRPALRITPVDTLCPSFRVRRSPKSASTTSTSLTRRVAIPLFSGLPGRLEVFGWHQDRFELPPGAIPLAGSIACTYQAFRFDVAAYGLQFHPEARAGDLASWARVDDYRRLLDAVDALRPMTSPQSSRG